MISPPERKVSWLGVFFIDAALLTSAVMLPRARSTGLRWLAGTLVVLILLGSFVLSGVAANAWTSTVISGNCLPVGMGDSAYESSFIEAYLKDGGSDRLGCAIANMDHRPLTRKYDSRLA